MNNRFSALKDNSSHRRGRDNNQKKKTTNNSGNRFRKQEKVKSKEKDIEISSNKEFPQLNPECNNTNNEKLKHENAGLTYIEKIKLFKEENLEVEKLEKGWQFLPTKKNIKKNQYNNSVENPYYNPELAFSILNNRDNYREELNEILGDISPYWDMSIYEPDLNDELIDETWQRYDDVHSEQSDNDECFNDY